MCGGVWSPAQDLWFYSSHSFFLEAGGYPSHHLCHRGKPASSLSTSVHIQVLPFKFFWFGSFFFLTVDVDHRELGAGYSLNRTLLAPPYFIYFIATLRTHRKTGHCTSEHLCCAICVDSHEKQVTESWWPCRTGVWPWVCLTFYFSAPLSAKK